MEVIRKTCLLFLCCLGCLTASAVTHRVGTYNIRTNNTQDDKGDAAWVNRREAVMQVIRDTMQFDIVALQEVTTSQRTYIHGQLQNVYSFAEHDKNCNNQLLYRTSKYTCLDKGAFYLAPDITKSGHYWDAEFERTVVWVKLQDKESDEILFFAATHLDLHPISIREGARTAAEQMLKICGDYPCILTGDMNCELVEHDPHSYYYASFGNARDMTKTEPKGPYSTYVGSRKPTSVDGKLIDFVYVRGMEVESYEVGTAQCGLSILPSDHMPVLCEVTLLPYNRKRTHVVNNVAQLREEAAKIPAGEIIYLKRGAYDLGNESLSLASSCVIQGNEDAYLTGACQLFTMPSLVSLELRDLTIRDASCPQGGFGSIVNGSGRYVRLVDCTIDNCSTNGMYLIKAEDCSLEITHTRFIANRIAGGEGCLHTSGRDVFPTTIMNSIFEDNEAIRGTALYYTSNATAYIYGNSFVNNRAEDKGAVVLMADENITDIRLVNNSFIGNRIDVEAGFLTDVGGAAIWQEMSNNGGMTLMNNTIVGNYTAVWDAPGVSSEEFAGGAVYNYSGILGAYNNIIAGNYCSLAGRGDIYMEDPSLVRGGANNIFSSEDNTNYPIGMFDFNTDSYAAACTELVSLFGGQIKEGVYQAPINRYGVDAMVALSPLITRYADQDINILDEEAMSAAAAGSDIMNVGSLAGTLTSDQLGTTRNAYSVPGSMEVGQQPMGIEDTPYTIPPTPYTKHLLNGHVLIQCDEQWYNVLGEKMK